MVCSTMEAMAARVADARLFNNNDSPVSSRLRVVAAGGLGRGRNDIFILDEAETTPCADQKKGACALRREPVTNM